MRSLLDVNVLIALFDADHADHRRARTWFEAEIEQGWASCAITQNGFLRVVSQPRYPSPVTPTEAMRRLRQATRTDHHLFWPCDLSILDQTLVDGSAIHGSRQLTDVYLLALAVAHDGRLVTFYRSVPRSAVAGATPDSLVTL